MFQLLSILALVAAASSTPENDYTPTTNQNTSPATYEYFEPKAKLVKERIESLQINLNILLVGFSKRYRPSKPLNEAIDIYKFSTELAEGTSCGADKNKFDTSFQELRLNCAATSTILTATDMNLGNEIGSLLGSVQEIDYMLKVISEKFSKESKQFDWPGDVDKPKLHRALNEIISHAVKLFQLAIGAMNTQMKDCIEKHEELMLGKVIEAYTDIRNCKQ